jgi:hypothetical protein
LQQRHDDRTRRADADARLCQCGHGTVIVRVDDGCRVAAKSGKARCSELARLDHIGIRARSLRLAPRRALIGLDPIPVFAHGVPNRRSVQNPQKRSHREDHDHQRREPCTRGPKREPRAFAAGPRLGVGHVVSIPAYSPRDLLSSPSPKAPARLPGENPACRNRPKARPPPSCNGLRADDRVPTLDPCHGRDTPKRGESWPGSEILRLHRTHQGAGGVRRGGPWRNPRPGYAVSTS